MLRKSKDDMAKLRESKGVSVIPKGSYCYSNMRQSGANKDGLPTFKVDLCPYWDSDDEKGDQEYGYCWFLQGGDWETNETKEWKNEKTGEIQTANEIGIPLGLLWDQCKECGVNEYYEESSDE